MKAHTSPTAQYTLVSIRGKNSMVDPAPAPEEKRETRRGKKVTNACKKANPKRYHRSTISRITYGSDLGNLGFHSDATVASSSIEYLLVYPFIKRLHDKEDPKKGVNYFYKCFCRRAVSFE
jgi:hypothetical protein